MQLLKKYPWIVVLVLSCFLPFIPFLFGYFPATGDMRDVFIPLESFFHTQQLQGNIPAWNPAVSFGFPVIAAAQIGFFYPVLFILRFLPIYLELPLVLIFHIALCAIGMFLFSRRIGLSKEASLFSAISFSLSQFIWQHLTHLNIFLAVAWFPWQMLAVDILFRTHQYGGPTGKIERKGVVALIALFGSPFLIGQIQVPFLMMTIALVYGMYLKFSHPLQLPLRQGESTRTPLLTKERLGEVIRNIAAPIILIALGTFLLASVQLLPTLELSSLSSRSGAGGFDIVRANQHSYPLYHLPTLLFPRFYGNDDTYWGKRLEIEYGTYIGVIPFLFAVWYLWSRVPLSQIWERVRVRAGYTAKAANWGEGKLFFLYLLVVSFLLALGSLSPFRLIGLEPSLWIFSAPARWLLFATFSLSLFAGLGFDAVWENIVNVKKVYKKIAFVIIGLVVITNIALVVVSPLPNWGEGLPAGRGEGWLGAINSQTQIKINSLISSAKSSSISLLSPYTYIPLIILFILPYALSHKHGKKIIVALTIADLAIIAGTTTPVISWKSILTPPASIERLPQAVKEHTARVYSLRDGGDTGAYFTDPFSRANASIRELQKNLLVPMVSSQFGIYSIEWPASLDLSEQGAVLEKLHPTLAYAIEDTALAQELNIGVVLSPVSDGTVGIKTLESKPRVEVINGTTEIISEQPSELVIHTNAKQDTTLIVRDTFYPGWHAYVDDKEVAIAKSPLFFRSVSVPAGEHVVRMKYVPKMLYLGGILSLLTLCSLAATWLRK